MQPTHAALHFTPQTKLPYQIAPIHTAKSYENLTAYIKTDKIKTSIFGERVIYTDETGVLYMLTPRKALAKIGEKNSVITDLQC